MTRPFFDPGVHAHTRPHHRQLQYCYREAVRGRARIGSYSASMASMIGHHGPHAGGATPKKNNSNEKKHNGGNHCPPVSTSHLLAVNLGEVYPPNTCKDSRGLFDGLVGAIERHILHSDPSGNVKIPSSLLHIGECPEVPEHLATFALRRSGSLHFRQPQDEANEQTEEVAASKSVTQKRLLGHHTKSEPKLSSCSKSTSSRSPNSTCCDLSSVSQFSTGSSGSNLSSAAGTPRSSGLRRTFSWHRIKDKLKR